MWMIRQLCVAAPHLAQVTGAARGLALVHQGAAHPASLDAYRFEGGHRYNRTD
jgi:hypothetical protein